MLHTRFLYMLGTVSTVRRRATRIDVVELWTDSHHVDMVAIEEGLRTRSIDSIVVRCAGGGTAETYLRPHPAASWEDFLHFLDEVAGFRALYNIDFALRAWIRIETPEAAQHWEKILEPRGWRADYVVGAESAEPPLFDGKPALIEPGDALTIGVDGTLGSGESLLASRYSEILATRGIPA